MSYQPAPQPGEDATITIDPTAMPAGTELSLGILELKGDVRASYSALIDASAYTCAGSLPTDAGQHLAHDAFFRLGSA